MGSTTTTNGSKRLEPSQVPRKLGPGVTDPIDIGSALVQVKVRSPDARGGFSLIEYRIPSHTLVAPLHRHTWEDEYSFVLEGRLGALIGDEVIYVEPGELVFKPRRLWHTIWNAGDTPCRILEHISPGGFERFFEEFASALQGPANQAVKGDLGARYGVDSDFERLPRICAEHGLAFPPLSPAED
jgi:mannose-6-phosphate isomerase-like protein (cupin superfamily)